MMNTPQKNNNNPEPSEYGWILAFFERWIPSPETKRARVKLLRFFEKNGFLKMANGVYARSSKNESFEDWKNAIKPLIPRDGLVNVFFVSQKQWDNMTIYPAADKF